MQWLKLYTEILDDPKIRLLAFEDRWHYVALLCCKAEGIQDERHGIWERLLSVKLGLAEVEFDSLKKRLMEVFLIDANWNPTGWDKRQQATDKSAAERQKKYRDRLRKRGDKPHLVRQHIHALQERDGTRCVYCGADNAGHVDHVVPLNDGGSNDIDNLALSCKQCNSGKGGRTPQAADMPILFGALRGRYGVVTGTSRVEEEIEVEIEVEKEVKTPSSLSAKADPIPVTKIIDLYHSRLPQLPKCQKLTKAREGYIKQRWREDMPAMSNWENFFDYVAGSQFLTGRTEPRDGKRPFLADLEWITKASNFAKILEGKYHGI